MERPASEPLVERLRVGFASVTHSIRWQGRDEVRSGDTPKVRAGPAFCTRDACTPQKYASQLRTQLLVRSSMKPYQVRALLATASSSYGEHGGSLTVRTEQTGSELTIVTNCR
jgi:hypothetical protein